MIQHTSSASTSSSRSLFLASAALGLLGSIVPLSSYGDGTFFSGGALFVVPIVTGIALLVTAAVQTSATAVALGGGAAVAMSTFFAAVMLPSWVISQGEGFAAGAWFASAAAVVAAVAAARAVIQPDRGVRNPLSRVAVGAAALMCAGLTLVPPGYSGGTTWADWNRFSDYFNKWEGVGTQLLTWGPLIAMAVGQRARGRLAILFGIGGALPMLLLIFAVQAGLADGGSDFGTFRPKIHPVGWIGAIGLAVVLAVGLAKTSAERPATLGAAPPGVDPPRWAPDPTGRHTYRFWDGASWTSQVSDGSTVSVDDRPVTVPPPQIPAPPPRTVQMPQVAPPVFAQYPVAPPPVAHPPVSPTTSPQWAPMQPSAPSPGLEATVERSRVRHQFAIMLDDGRITHAHGFAIVGRGPTARPGEADATLVVVDDPTLSVSKSHLAIGVDPDGFWIQDRGSTNGSSFTVPGGVPQRAEPERMHRVPRGTRVDIGDRWLHIE